MKLQLRFRIGLGLASAVLSLAFTGLAAPGPQPSLEQGWTNPPTSARLRAYWWWLNGNVTKAAITRDLEEMKAKGFGGALICDAGGAEQDGNDPVPHGPTFFTPEWRELYRHALREADRLGLEMSLNIQSGWNLGGPVVKPEDAAKKLTWSEMRLTGPARFNQALPMPKTRDGFYRDVAVVAFKIKAVASVPSPPNITASSSQPGHAPELVLDGNADTFWVSAGTKPGEGPTPEHPEWIQARFAKPARGLALNIAGRPGYGPRECELQVSQDGKAFRSLRKFKMEDGQPTQLTVDDANAAFIRVVVLKAYDQGSPESPRNVQVASLSFYVKDHPVSAMPAERKPIQNWSQKAMYSTLHFSAPDTSPLFQDFPATPGEEDTHTTDVLDLTAKLDKGGVLRWDVPAGQWQVLRFGCTIGDHSRVSTCSQGWQGYALDVLDAEAFQRYWDAVMEPLIADAGPLAGKTLRYLHTDSWEVEAINWTPTLRKEFRRRRGYDLLPFLPVLAGRIVNSREESNRFLDDFRKTLGDLAVDHHFKLFSQNAHRHNLLIHPESGGPHAVPIDAQRCLGVNDAPMSEFWAWSWRHRVGDSNRFFVKQPASAAHTYGHRLVLAEGFTTIGPHWQETLWDNLKPAFDQAACEGLNLLVWHAFVCSPAEMGVPGQQYFAGTHFNPNSTWWPKSQAFLAYLNRSQFLLQQGLFVADACYYYGDHVPNFAQLKRSDPAHLLPGYDYDVITEDALLNRARVRDGRLVLPDGMSYRLLVLPDRQSISLPVLRKLKDFVHDGATVIGPKPVGAHTLTGFPKCDADVARLADQLWGSEGEGSNGVMGKWSNSFSLQRSNSPPIRPSATPAFHAFGKGRIVSGRTARAVLLADDVKPDFEYSGQADTFLDYVHRRAGAAEIYFVVNRSNRSEEAICTFRVSAMAPELWDPVSGQHQFAAAYHDQDGRTTLPLQFPPCGSWFVLFREPAEKHPATAGGNQPRFVSQEDLGGPWTVRFDPKWGGPPSAQFDQLVSWTTRPEPGIKYYSGTAIYEKVFDLPAPAGNTPRPTRFFLDLGSLRQLAEVRLNGRNLGTVWAPPFRVDITEAVKPTANALEVEVVNFWPNRIIGDQQLPADQRFTRTNIRKLTRDTPLMDSGLFGPVRILGQAP